MNCFKCSEPVGVGEIYYKREEGPECRSCHIVKVFGSLQAFGKQAGLGTLYQYSKEYIQSWGAPN